MTGIDASEMTVGATQALLTSGLEAALARRFEEFESVTDGIDDAEVSERFSRHVGEVVARHLAGMRKSEDRVALVNSIMRLLGDESESPVAPPQELTGILPRGRLMDRHAVTVRPQTPLNDAALLTNASHDPSLNSELRSELATADRVDLLCAFVKWQGLRLLEDQLRAFRDRGGRLRVITTTYIGATQRQAIDRLVNDFGAEVKVQYDIERTRLHAKSWYFHRNSGWDTAYVGSSNLSRAALLDGVEWNVRLSKQQTGSLLSKFRYTFESYWNDPSYQSYDPDRDASRLDAALSLASGRREDRESFTEIAGLDVHPYPHQEEVLERLRVEREVRNHHENLVVAATGTGKTVIAALDYRDGIAPRGSEKSLLFVAHRIEILTQARSTYRAVLKDGAFGELLGDEYEPQKWRHVFATVQSLGRVLDRLEPDRFDVVVIDEFHHAEAATYKRILGHLAPGELLGLTATPERADGVDVRSFFGGRTAAEIRLWDALEADLLSPFHYFSISDNTDLSTLPWRRGSYGERELEALYVGNQERVALILKQLEDKVLDPRTMKAFGFCVSVSHAEYMAEMFRRAGLPAVAVTGESPKDVRNHAKEQLRRGEICAIFTVDLFNEGIDLPSIDTVMFLRPTESATIFLQQLGRGLRKDRDKPVLTALDFVGMQRNEFRFDEKFRALTGATRREITEGIEKGFAYLPPGTEISIDEAAQAEILKNLKRQLAPKWPSVVSEMRQLKGRAKDPSLAWYLNETGFDLPDVLRGKDKNWTRLLVDAGVPAPKRGPRHDAIIGRARALAHVDDRDRLRVYRAVLRGEVTQIEELSEQDHTLALMLLFSIWPSGGGFSNADDMLKALADEPAACAEFLEVLDVAESSIAHVSHDLVGRLRGEVIRAHAHYSREEIVVGLRYSGFDRRPDSLREGVFYSSTLRTDAFLVTLKKNEKNYSPTTMYNDVAISPTLFHWESQSTTSVDSTVGQRYIHHQEQGSEVLLFGRETKGGELGIAAPYMCLGTADYVRHAGSRPIEFDWKLRTPMPGDFFAKASAVR